MQNPFDKFDAVESGQTPIDLTQVKTEEKVNPFDQFGGGTNLPKEATPYVTSEGSARPIEYSPFLFLEPLNRLGDWLGVTENADYRETDDGRRLNRIDEMAAAWDTGSADLGRWGIAIEAFVPVSTWVDADGNELGPLNSPSAQAASLMEGARLMSARERYGDAYVDTMTLQERVTHLEKLRVQRAEARHTNTLDMQTEIGVDKTSSVIGSVAAEVSPTILFPVGRGLKAMAGIGSAIALQSELSRQTTTGDYDLVSLGLHTAVGGFLTPVVAAPIRSTKAAATAAKNTVNYVTNKTKALAGKKGSTKAANSVVAKMNDLVADKVVNNVPEAEILPAVFKELGLKDKDALVIFGTSTLGKPIIPTIDDAAKVVVARSNPLASTTRVGKAWDNMMAPLQSVIRLNSQKVGNLVREFEFRSAVNTAQTQEKATPFLAFASRVIKKEKDPVIRAKYDEMETALMNGQFKTAFKIGDEYFPDIIKQFKKVDPETGVTGAGAIPNLLDDIHRRALAAGIKVGKRVNYFPRVVKDLQGIQQAVGTEGQSIAENALKKIAKKKGVEVSDLEDDVITAVYNRVLSGSKTGMVKRTGASRTVQEINPKLKEFYHDAPTALTIYTQRMEREIAKRQFFNQQKSLKKVEGTENVDLSGSIGEMLGKLRKKGELNHVQEDNLRALLTARFEGGEQAMNGVLASVRDVQYMATLANFQSAMIQLADVGSSMYVNGLGNTIKQIASGRKGARITMQEMALANRTSAEFGNMDGFSKALDKTMRASLFTGVDRAGKSIFINSSFRKYSQLAEIDPEAFIKKWNPVFGNDTVKLMNSLKKGEVDDNVKLMLWNELSEVQPISLSEMPAAYLNNPNGRVFYAMKSFMLKQLGLIRKDIVQEYRKGNTKQAVENATRYALIMGTANATVQDMRNYVKAGFDTEGMTVQFDSPEEFGETMSDAVIQSLFDIIFLSKYQQERNLETGNWGQFLQSQLAPASIGLADAIGQAAVNLNSDTADDYDKVTKLLNKLPPFGNVIYTFLFGGAEEFVEKKQMREEQSKRKEALRRATS